MVIVGKEQATSQEVDALMKSDPSFGKINNFYVQQNDY